jgi:HlyD family secretion protein
VLLILLALGCGQPNRADVSAPGVLTEEPVEPPAPVGARGLPGVVVPLQEVDVLAPLSGKLLSVQAAIGDEVREGQLLARLDDEGVALEIERQRAEAAERAAGVASARIELESALRELERVQSLLEERAASRAAYEAAEDRRRLAQATLEQSEAGLARARATERVLDHQRAACDVISPLDGVVGVAEAEPGATVQPSDVLFRVASRSTYVRFAVPEPSSVGFSVGDEVLLRPYDGASEAAPARGRISWLSPDVDPAARARVGGVEVEVEDARAWIVQPGRFVRVLEVQNAP